MPITRDLLIGGTDRPARGGRTTTVTTPHTGAVHATVAAAEPDDVTAAITAADNAFRDWAALSPFERRAIFLRAADLLEARTEQAVQTMAGEVGAAAGWAGFNVWLAANTLREAAAAITAPRGEVLTTQQPGILGLAVRQPVGVVAAFAPWNAPIILGIRALAAPLAAGNTVVLKPSEFAPLASGLFLADVLREAGLPDGVLNVITNDPADAPVIAETLIADDRVRAVNFTGSTAVGRIIGTLAAQHLKPAVLELGGKNSVIVLADADVDYAVTAAAFAMCNNVGQICMSADRLLVHESLAEEFTDKLAAAVEALPAGDPADPTTVIGPLMSPAAASRVAALVADAVTDGAKLVAGGGDPNGAHYPATLLTDVPAHARLHHTESFGPVCAIDTFETDDEAVDKANDTENGLSAGVITEDTSHGLRVAARLRTGIVHINDQTVMDEPQAPFGGFKSSGYGRFGGRWGIESFSNTRWLTMATDHARFPF
ncbi:aldehyde dehydrogenase family protein [Nocardia macrotermitis]|uniref:Vanillin dehydrogenase n=1 Tax=Nocardia macrotermitis TaxID=2585198 RepID=A0A7K0D7Q2_9NOCA|nr:aldehyde dehydrogenase family protein [Nocardia macrotermitis]MQY21805.1 Vanillin dehydrogenase [Nocardia macrotermitis]